MKKARRPVTPGLEGRSPQGKGVTSAEGTRAARGPGDWHEANSASACRTDSRTGPPS
jgi:hypothetical protein